MRLDNKGWSLNTLLICIVVLLIFLMLAIFNAYKLSSKLSNDFSDSGNINNITDSGTNDNSTIINDNNDSTGDINDGSKDNNSTVNIPEYYKTKESQLQAATIRYLKENAITVAEDEKIIIRISDVIKDKYIQSIKDDMTNNTCDAYSVVGFKDNDYVVTSYISCDSYETQNYGVTE